MFVKQRSNATAAAAAAATQQTPTSTNNNTSSSSSSSAKPASSYLSREVRTLNIELVRDARTDRLMSVSEAMCAGILDRSSLKYHNTLTGESCSLSKAHELGHIIGQYADTQSGSNVFVDHTSSDVRAYSIVSVLDAASGRTHSFEQAIRAGLFEPTRAAYVHPVTRELVGLAEAIRLGFIRAETTTTTTTTNDQQQQQSSSRYDASGVDKRIKSTRHTTNSDGTSVLQIEIECARPTRGFYQVDEIEEMAPLATSNIDDHHHLQQHHQQTANTTTTCRQVVDINSVHRVVHQQQQQQSIEDEERQRQRNEIKFELSRQQHQQHHQQHHTHHIIKRIEDVIEEVATVAADNDNDNDDDDQNKYRASTRLDIDTTARQSRSIVQQQQQQPALVIDDSHEGAKRIDIAAQSHIYRNEVQIGNVGAGSEKPSAEAAPAKLELITSMQRNLEILDRRLVELEDERRRALLTPPAAAVPLAPEPSSTTHTTTHIAHLDLDDRQLQQQRPLSREVRVQVDLDDAADELQKPPSKQLHTIAVQTVDDDEHEANKRALVVTNQPPQQQQPQRKPQLDNETTYTDYFETTHTIQRPRPPQPPPPLAKTETVTTTTSVAKPVAVPVEVVVEPKPKVTAAAATDDDDEENFEEWTEVYTITVRGARHKIKWVYDSSEKERVSLGEAARRHVVDTQAHTYHHRAAQRTLTFDEAVDDGLVGTEPADDASALTLTCDAITYTIYWVWDPVRSCRCAPARAVRRGLLDARTGRYTNYASGESCSVHEAVHMGFVGAKSDDDDDDDNERVNETLTLETKSGECVRITWVKDARTGERLKPRVALRRGLLDLARLRYKRYDTNETMSIGDAILHSFVGTSESDRPQQLLTETTSDADEEEGGDNDDESDNEQRSSSDSSADEEELRIKTRTAIYVITGLVHPDTQKEIKVSEAIAGGILDAQTGAYTDAKTGVTYEVGEAINEGVVFATVTDLLQDESASTEFVRVELKHFIVKSVLDPRNKVRIGALQAQAAGILNYAQGMYTNPTSGDKLPIGEAIERRFIDCDLKDESSREEFDAEVVTETLMERCITRYCINGVLDSVSGEWLSASEAVHRQLIDTETNSYVDASERNSQPVPIKEAVRRRRERTSGAQDARHESHERHATWLVHTWHWQGTCIIITYKLHLSYRVSSVGSRLSPD